MKKLFLAGLLFCSLIGKAQTSVIIVNDSDFTFFMGTLETKPANYDSNIPSTGFPRLASSDVYSFYLLPGESYVLENTANLTRFPFNSPASTPFIANWYRYASLGAAGTLATSNGAWLAYGNSQFFHFIKSGVYNSVGNIIAGGSIGVAPPPGSLSNGVVSNYSSGGVDVSYFENIVSSTQKEHVIYISNL